MINQLYIAFMQTSCLLVSPEEESASSFREIEPAHERMVIAISVSLDVPKEHVRQLAAIYDHLPDSADVGAKSWQGMQARERGREAWLEELRTHPISEAEPPILDRSTLADSVVLRFRAVPGAQVASSLEQSLLDDCLGRDGKTRKIEFRMKEWPTERFLALPCAHAAPLDEMAWPKVYDKNYLSFLESDPATARFACIQSAPERLVFFTLGRSSSDMNVPPLTSLAQHAVDNLLRAVVSGLSTWTAGSFQEKTKLHVDGKFREVIVQGDPLRMVMGCEATVSTRCIARAR
jgi:hypothetical protein